MDMEIAIIVNVSGSVQEVIEKVRTALQNEQFGIISFVNVSEKIQDRIGKTMPPYIILGACNPKLSYEAIQSDDRIGLLLPCNVVVSQIDEQTCKVIFSNPIPLMKVDPFRENAVIQEVARKAYEGLKLAAEHLSEE